MCLSRELTVGTSRPTNKFQRRTRNNPYNIYPLLTVEEEEKKNAG